MSETTGILNAIEISPSKFGGDQVRINVSGVWYDYGKFPPRGMTDGDTVKVKFTTNDRGYHKVERGGLFKVDPSSAPSAPAAAATGAAPKPTYVDNRQDTISKQAAVNTAIEMVDLLIRHGGIKLPAKPADVFAVISGAVQEEAVRLFKQNTGGTWTLEEEKVAVGGGRVASAGDNGADDYPD